MIYIVSALYAEAKPLIEKFNLKKDNFIQKFQIFSNEKISVIISGIGRIKASIALTYLLANKEIKEDDFVFNIGFCASANKEDNLLDVVMISQIKSAYSKYNFYPDMLYKHNFLEGTLICYDEIVFNFQKEVSEKIYIDMESAGFYETASLFFKKDKIIVLKIISDILEEKSEKRKLISDFSNNKDFEETYKKIFDFIEKIENFFKNDKNEFSEDEIIFIKKIRQNLKLSDTMYYEFLNLLKYLKLSGKEIKEYLLNYENIEIKSKLEGKIHFENIKKRIIE